MNLWRGNGDTGDSKEASTPRRPVLRNLLPVMVFMLSVLFAGVGMLFWRQHSVQLSTMTEMAGNEVIHDLKTALEQEARGLAMAALPVAMDTRVQEALAARDAGRLMSDWGSLFHVLQSEQSLTHFLFFDSNRVCLLRVHKPELDGDTIDRFSAREAERTGRTAWSVEIGSVGTATLRVVQPVFDGKRLVGYVELGKEIESILRSVQPKDGIETAVSLKKDSIQRDAYEASARFHGYQSDWDHLPEDVITMVSQEHMRDAFAQMVDSARLSSSDEPVQREVEYKERTWGATAWPLADASGKVVCTLLVLNDITSLQAAFTHNMVVGGLVGLAILALLFGLTLMVIRRTDRSIRAQQIRLRESEEHSAATLRSIGDGVITCNAKGEVVDLNPAAEMLTGWTSAEAAGRPVGDVFRIFNAQTRCPVENPVFRSMRDDVSLDLAKDTVLTARDGTERHVADSCSPMHDASGAVFGAVLAFRDVTDEYEQRKELLDNEETHRALIEGLPDIVIRFDRDGRHLYVSNNVRETVDIEPEAFIGKTHAELGFPAEHCRFWEESIRKVFDSGIPFETEFTFEGKTGTVVFNWRLIPARDFQGAVSSVISVSRDITAHRKAEKEYQTLFREMLDGLALHEIILDSAGIPVDYRFLAANPAFERMTGLRVEEILGRTVLEVMPGTERVWIETYGRVALTGEPVQFVSYAAELEKYFEVTAFRPALGQFACIFQDITERLKAKEEKERLQAQLAQAQKMESVGRLAGGVAHDFNNMLGVILGHVEMALEELDPSLPLFDDLGEIRDAAIRSADLTRQLLAFARKQTVAPVVLDINQTVESMLKMLKRIIGEDLELAWVPGVDAGSVKIDPSQVDQILVNLCVNARDAISGTGRVTIETGSVELDAEYCGREPDIVVGDYVMLAVSDNGVGMDTETQSHLFEPFFTTKELGKGTGLGLATVHGIVKQNSGFITVYSEPGFGTTIKIYLPRHRLTSEPPVAAEVTQNQVLGETILLVEDEPAIQKVAVRMLQRAGYTVLVAGTPSEAIRVAIEHEDPIDLLLTDVVMPQMNGRDLARKVQAIHSEVKCLYMSGYTADVIAHHGVLDEGVSLLQKPFSPKALAAKVREVLDGR